VVRAVRVVRVVRVVNIVGLHVVDEVMSSPCAPTDNHA
jgi:hypothetical protein